VTLLTYRRYTNIFIYLSIYREADKNVLKFTLKNLVLKFHFLLLGAL